MTSLEYVFSRKIVAIVRGLKPKYIIGLGHALEEGGIGLMEVTYNQQAPETWKATADAIAAVEKEFGDRVLVGAGTVITLEQIQMTYDAGGHYLVTPATQPEIIRAGKAMGLGVFPGAMTPAEILQAYNAGADAVKVFPAGCLGPAYIKAIRAPLSHVPLMAVGGVNEKNLAEYISAPFIHAVGGSWLCAKADIAAHNFDKITSLCKEARRIALGFEIAHIGVNTADADESLAVCQALDAAFGFGVKEGNSSNFAGSGVEVMKSPYLGKNGHIAVKTNSIPRAAAELAKNGFTLDESTAKYKGEKMVAVYLKQEFGGFAVHLLQK